MISHRELEQRKQLIASCRSALSQGADLDQALLACQKKWQPETVSSANDNNDNSDPPPGDSTSTTQAWTNKLPLAVSFTVGIALIVLAIGPTVIFFWQDQVLSLAQAGDKMIAPIPSQEVLDYSPQENLAQASQEPVMSDVDQLDYSNLSNWFVVSDGAVAGKLPAVKIASNAEASATASGLTLAATASQPYSLAVESLGINNAAVKVGGLDLNNNLIHYESTARPGSLGTTVIFGHSTLRQWYNPAESNPERYKSIFSTIMTLNLGDQITLTTDNQTYTYQVTTKKNVKPENTDAILAQDPSGSYLRLVTCTPEGTTLMRGLVEAVLVK